MSIRRIAQTASSRRAAPWAWLFPFGLLVALAAVSGGCARDADSVDWGHNRLLAEADFVAGRLDSALVRFEQLAQRASTSKDAVQAWLRLGDVQARRARVEDAASAYVQAYRAAAIDDDRAMAALRVAELALDSPQLGAQWEGGRALWAVIRHYPNTTAALRALDSLESRYLAAETSADRGSSAVRAMHLLSRAPAIRGSRAAGHASLRAARRRMELGGEAQLRHAQRTLEALAAQRPRLATWDDAMFELAEVYRRQGNWVLAERTWREILSLREEPRIFGNYETRYYPRSLWAIIRMQVDDLGDRDAGVALLAEFVAEYPFSRLWDDALFEYASLLLQMGRPDAAHAVLGQLVAERPESGYVSRARALLAGQPDPGAARAWERPTTLNGEPL